MLHIALLQPEIPPNTGNIVRTCAVTGAKLFLVRPLGFHVTDRWLKRAGLDYWDRVRIKTVDDLDGWLAGEKKPTFFFSSKAQKSYIEAPFTEDSLLIFGSETEGLPEFFWVRHRSQGCRKGGA